MHAARATLPGSLTEFEVHDISAAFEPLNVFVSVHREREGEPWQLLITSEQEISAPELNVIQKADWSLETIADRDWLAESYRGFPAFAVGPFFIHGSHHEDTIPEDKTSLQIDAATAFGSGEHGTTKGCLLAMLDLKDQGVCPWNILDMGTGSGILAIAAWKLWKTPVLAVDNDEEAVRVACRHREINKIPAGETDMLCKAGDGFNTRAVQDKKPFDLVIANILAVTLKEMVGELKAVSDTNGFVILSGIRINQAEEVLYVYGKSGFELRQRYEIDDWSTLVLQNIS